MKMRRMAGLRARMLRGGGMRGAPQQRRKMKRRRHV
jgi:hypothetical protein